MKTYLARALLFLCICMAVCPHIAMAEGDTILSNIPYGMDHEALQRHLKKAYGWTLRKDLSMGTETETSGDLIEPNAISLFGRMTDSVSFRYENGLLTGAGAMFFGGERSVPLPEYVSAGVDAYLALLDEVSAAHGDCIKSETTVLDPSFSDIPMTNIGRDRETLIQMLTETTAEQTAVRDFFPGVDTWLLFDVNADADEWERYGYLIAVQYHQ